MRKLQLISILSIFASSLLGCVQDNDPDLQGEAEAQGPCGKCDGSNDARPTPAEMAVARIHRDALRGDGLIDGDEALALVAFLKKAEGRNEAVASYLQALLSAEVGMDDAARDTLEMALMSDAPDEVPLANDLYVVEPGQQDFLFDDRLYLLSDGALKGETGIVSHSRGYAAKRDGVLFNRHGSQAPHYASTHTQAQTDALRVQGPDVALDRAAEIYGLNLGPWGTFSAFAHDPNVYDPSSNTPFWAGICQGWTHNALDNRISVLVDPQGPEGERGLWIFGQWISRADLGNAAMGASFSFGIADAVTIDSFVTPDSLVKALAQHVLRSRRGLRVDIWNDAHNPSGFYDPQIWNQPIVSGGIEVASVSEETAEAIRAFAALKNHPTGSTVKRVQATATWGVEARDDWEGEALFKESTWNIYMITNDEGLVLKAYMANTLHEAGVAALPVIESDGLPDYIAVPRHELTDASFERQPHRLLDPSNPEGVRYRFLMGVVLAQGIPNTTRAAFEAEAFEALPSDLAARYPGIANAYHPEDWRRVFEPTLGPGARFGALWDAGR